MVLKTGSDWSIQLGIEPSNSLVKIIKLVVQSLKKKKKLTVQLVKTRIRTFFNLYYYLKSFPCLDQIFLLFQNTPTAYV